MVRKVPQYLADAGAQVEQAKARAIHRVADGRLAYVARLLVLRGHERRELVAEVRPRVAFTAERPRPRRWLPLLGMQP